MTKPFSGVVVREMWAAMLITQLSPQMLNLER